MRSFLLALVLATTAAHATPSPQPVEAPAKKGPKPQIAIKFPLPKDAVLADTQAGGGRILMYKVPRGRDAVVAELKQRLGQGGWKLTKESTSPSGNAVRLEATHGDKLYKVSFTGDDAQAGLILTLPE